MVHKLYFLLWLELELTSSDARMSSSVDLYVYAHICTDMHACTYVYKNCKLWGSIKSKSVSLWSFIFNLSMYNSSVEH